MVADIPIKFGTTAIFYGKNKYIPYDNVIQTIIDMNDQTQKCPVDME